MKLKYLLLSVVTSSLTLFCGEPAAGQWPKIKLEHEIASTKLASETVSVAKDPVYQTGKRYQAYPLQPLIRKLAKKYSGDLNQAVLVFTAIDGYKVSMAYSDALEEQGYLAFRDLSAPQENWVSFKFGREKITPAPFYLVWNKPGIDKWRYPWPFQLNHIEIEPASVYFGAAAPVNKNDTVTAGFAEFNRYCIRCHAVNGSGGTVGPELNTPQNVSEMYTDEVLKGLILNNPNYRPNSKMPVFDLILNYQQLDSIMTYLKSMKTHKLSVNESD